MLHTDMIEKNRPELAPRAFGSEFSVKLDPDPRVSSMEMYSENYTNIILNKYW